MSTIAATIYQSTDSFRSVRLGQLRRRRKFHCTVWSFPQFARHVRAKDQDRPHCVVPHHRPPSLVPRRPLLPPAVSRRLSLSDPFSCFLPSRAVPCRAPPLPALLAVLWIYLQSPGTSCLRSWGSWSLLMTAVLGIQRGGKTEYIFAVASRSGRLAVHRWAPRGPRPLRTLLAEYRSQL